MGGAASRSAAGKPFAHLVALDPPPGGATDPLLASGPLAHLAWTPAEAEFALGAYRWELDLRPALKAAYRALRELGPGAAPEALEAALRGPGEHPRGPEACALLVRVLGELALVEFGARSARVLEAVRTDLERSETFQDCAERLDAVERALAAELPARRAPAAVAR